MLQLQGVEQTAEGHPLLQSKLTAKEYRLLAGILLKQIETDSGSSEYCKTLAQQLLIQAALAEH